MDRWSTGGHQSQGRKFLLGGAYPVLYDCPVDFCPGDSQAILTRCSFLCINRERVYRYPLAHFFRDCLSQCNDGDLQDFLEYDGFSVRVEMGCFILEREGIKITISRARVIDVLIMSIAGLCEE